MSEQTKKTAKHTMPQYAICPHCGKPMLHLGTERTLVGYLSPPGHNHDDNCQSRDYLCPNGHRIAVSKRNRCPACDWIGRETCFCHNGKKINEWPVATE